jgi:hypothetical protein
LKKQADKQIEKHGGRYGKGFVKIGSGYAYGGSVNSGRVIRNSVNGRFIKTYNPIA